jgi:hypothetical protein
MDLMALFFVCICGGMQSVFCSEILVLTLSTLLKPQSEVIEMFWEKSRWILFTCYRLNHVGWNANDMWEMLTFEQSKNSFTWNSDENETNSQTRTQDCLKHFQFNSKKFTFLLFQSENISQHSFLLSNSKLTAVSQVRYLQWKSFIANNISAHNFQFLPQPIPMFAAKI